MKIISLNSSLVEIRSIEQNYFSTRISCDVRQGQDFEMMVYLYQTSSSMLLSASPVPLASS